MGRKNRVEVEVEIEKSDKEKDRYLQAEAWGIDDQVKSLNHAEEEFRHD